MIDEKHTIVKGAIEWWMDHTLWSIVALMIAGSVGRTLISPAKFNTKLFVGEVILSAVVAVLVFHLGLMQGMSFAQMLVFGALSSLGGLRLTQWFIKIAQTALSKEANLPMSTGDDKDGK